MKALQEIEGVVNVRFQEGLGSNTDQILEDKVTEQENIDLKTLDEEPKEKKGSYFIITQDDQTREHIAKTAVDYGILIYILKQS